MSHEPYRGVQLVARCSVCGELATEECLRCGRAFCDEHQLDEGRRCESCEAILEERLASHDVDPDRLEGVTDVGRWMLRYGLLFVIAMAIGVVGVAVQYLVPFLGVAIMALGVSVFWWTPWLVAIRRRREREVFLAERPQRQLEAPVPE